MSIVLLFVYFYPYLPTNFCLYYIVACVTFQAVKQLARLIYKTH